MAFRGWVEERSLGGPTSGPAWAAPGGVTYRLGWGPAVYMWVSALMWVTFAVLAATATGAHESDATRARAAVGFATFAALTVLAGLGMRRTRLTLDETGVELVGFGRPRRLLLEQIRGYRVLRVQAGTFFVLEPRQADVKKLKIPHIGKKHEAFLTWLSQVPDLDAVDRAGPGKQPGDKP